MRNGDDSDDDEPLGGRGRFGPFYRSMSDESRSAFQTRDKSTFRHRIAAWAVVVGMIPGLAIGWQQGVRPILAVLVDDQIRAANTPLVARIAAMQTSFIDVKEDLRNAWIELKENRLGVLVKERFEHALKLREDGSLNPHMRSMIEQRLIDVEREIRKLEDEIRQLRSSK